MKNFKLGIFILLSTLLFGFRPIKGTIDSETDDWHCMKNRNTYQLIINTRKPFSLPSDLCELINKNRHSNKIVFKQIDNHIQLKIYPFSKVKKLKGTSIKEINYPNN